MDRTKGYTLATGLMLSAVFILIGIYFFDDIKGQYQYQKSCQQVGGLHVNRALSKNVGWLAENYNDAKAAAMIDHVGFVRFSATDDASISYDLRYTGNNPQRDDSFEKINADAEKAISYRWRRAVSPLPENREISKYSYEVFDNTTNELLVSYYSFHYSDYDPKSKSFHAPGGKTCFHNLARNLNEKSSWMEAINNSFVEN